MSLALSLTRDHGIGGAHEVEIQIAAVITRYIMYQNNHERNLLQPISLTHLPLRPTTLSALTGAGFHSTKEVYEAVQRDDGRFVHFASELKKGDAKENEEGSKAYAEMLYREIVEAVSIVWEEEELPMDFATTNAPEERVVTKRPKTAAELLQIRRHAVSGNRSIITFCRALDELLAGGIALGELTELAGSPGSGKTTLCLQLSVNAALPTYCGGVQGRVVYIDTEGSFSPERCHDLATHLIRHVQSGLRRRQQRSKDDAATTLHPPEWNVTAQDILNNILVFRVLDVAELNAVLHGAFPTLLSSKSDDLPIRLLIIDSIAFPYRAGTAHGSVTDYVTRTQQLTATAATLTGLALRHQLAVVCVNHMTTTRSENASKNNDPIANEKNLLESSVTNPRTHLIPALGESWAHAVTTRLVLSKPSSKFATSLGESKSHQFRTCALTKSPSLPTGEANLVIGEAGIRGVDVVLEASKRARLREASS
jgi:RAD51-like protein 2